MLFRSMKDSFEKTATHKIRRFKYNDAEGDDTKITSNKPSSKEEEKKD